MSTVASVDYPNKRIYLSLLTVGQPLDTTQVYRDVRALRKTTEAHRAFNPMIVAGGNISKTAATRTQPYVQLLFGCRIVPYDQNQELLVIRETFSDDGFSGVDCFDRTGLVNQVDINYQVSPVEVRIISTGGSALTQTEHDKLMGITSSTAADNAAAVWAKAVEGLTAEEMMRVMLAALAGKRQGIGTATEQYMAQDGITPRITLTPTDANGNGVPIINGAP